VGGERKSLASPAIKTILFTLTMCFIYEVEQIFPGGICNHHVFGTGHTGNDGRDGI